jgi:hypothetical protein
MTQTRPSVHRDFTKLRTDRTNQYPLVLSCLHVPPCSIYIAGQVVTYRLGRASHSFGIDCAPAVLIFPSANSLMGLAISTTTLQLFFRYTWIRYCYLLSNSLSKCLLLVVLSSMKSFSEFFTAQRVQSVFKRVRLKSDCVYSSLSATLS